MPAWWRNCSVRLRSLLQDWRQKEHSLRGMLPPATFTLPARQCEELCHLIGIKRWWHDTEENQSSQRRAHRCCKPSILYDAGMLEMGSLIPGKVAWWGDSWIKV